MNNDGIIMIDHERLKKIREDFASVPNTWYGHAGLELLSMIDTLLAPPKSDPEEYRRLEEIRGWLAEGPGTVLEVGYHASLRYLLDLLDQREKIIHDLSLDGQIHASLERGWIVLWLREQSKAKEYQNSIGDSVLRGAADELESQGVAEPLPADHLLERVRVLEAALRAIYNETRVIDLHPENKVLHCERVAREALEGK